MGVARNNHPFVKITPPPSLVTRFIIYWLPVIFYAILIFYLSSLPTEAVPQLFSGQDITFHIVEYSILTILLKRAFKGYYAGGNYQQQRWLILIIALAYAATDEFHQKFVPSRYASFFDLAIDGVGVMIGSLFHKWPR